MNKTWLAVEFGFIEDKLLISWTIHLHDNVFMRDSGDKQLPNGTLFCLCLTLESAVTASICLLR